MIGEMRTLLLLLKEVGSARLKESNLPLISPNIPGPQKSCGTARFWNEESNKYSDVRPEHRV